MKKNFIFGMAALTATMAAAADSIEEVKAAAKKLAEQPAYSWVQTLQLEAGGGARGSGSTTKGKANKEGYVLFSLSQGEGATEAIIKGEKAVLKTEEGWMRLDELGSGSGGGLAQRSRGPLLARRVRGVKAPTAEAEELLAKVKSLTKAEGMYAGDLSDEAVKEMLSRGRRLGAGGESIQPTDTKGTAKFWIKDGILAKYEYNLQGKWKFSRDDQTVERAINRTTTLEIKDVGTTTVDVPDEAKKKLS